MGECFIPLGGLRLEKNLNALNFEVGDSVLSTTRECSVCNACGEMFDAPLLAMIFSNCLMEEYCACPKCLSKVSSFERRERAETDEAKEDTSLMSVEVKNAMVEEIDCAHHLGYLKSRPKNTSIPEECLTCSKIIECMY